MCEEIFWKKAVSSQIIIVSVWKQKYILAGAALAGAARPKGCISHMYHCMQTSAQYAHD